MRLLIGDQTLQLPARVFQQQRKAFIQPTLAVFGWRHAVKTHQRMQPEARQGFAPVGFALAVAGNEIQHRQQRLATAGEHRQLIAVLGQHRLAGVDHIQAGVGGQQLAQHLGFLLEALPGLTAIEKARQPRRAIKPLAGSVEAFQVIEQRDGVFQPWRVVQLQQRLAVHRQSRAFHMPGGAGAMRDFAEIHVPGQGPQQRGLADIGVADHREFQRLNHDRSPARPAAGCRRR